MFSIATETTALATGRSNFVPNYPCQEGQKKCLASGVRVIDGFQVHRDCWEWGYNKICNYPSKNNCDQYAHCYFVALLECLLTDSLGNCVNRKEEYSCKRWIPSPIESQKVRVGFKEKEGPEGLVCKGIPCIDGNCVDKSYMTNGEMMDSISKLYAVSQLKSGNGMNVKLFEGLSMHCSKKAIGYSNCCSVDQKGWGKNFGAGCSKDEQLLIDKRKKNLCVYVGKEGKQNLGVTKIVKHYYCCFGQMLDKVIQVEGRKQLGMSFGSGGNPNCRGLTLDEILRIDFNRVDFTEFIEEFKVKFFGKYKAPNNGDMSMRVKGSLQNIRQYDDNPNNQANNQAGWNIGAEEERKGEAIRQTQQAE
ncbi:conjugal transfer protein TraN [Candidatus Tisiphia endosymbiont of Melanophora roralis]|uniref:conjugal transfer protein TraN n=1 Tax=Candidatus Tisiphia endosymbiont of Melanophora roralis TaxID=3066261 RepID=UPI001E7CCABB|nr:MAG: conjugal transfer protein TraN [Rickettsia endosymbiont of Cimex lectularius]